VLLRFGFGFEYRRLDVNGITRRRKLLQLLTQRLQFILDLIHGILSDINPERGVFHRHNFEDQSGRLHRQKDRWKGGTCSADMGLNSVIWSMR
jgi:hypothetical protein